MMASITTSELDFNAIRSNLKAFLSGQSTFKDYNFDGSAIGTIIDLLAYNTHYNALYTNLAINEMFLDSASKRSSVVSIANQFGYTPNSSKCPMANLKVVINSTVLSSPSVVIPAYSPFSTQIDGVTYVFYTQEDYNAQKVSVGLLNTYTFDSIMIYEGTPRLITYVCSIEGERFILPYTDIDLDTLVIYIQETPNSPETTYYARANTIYALTDTDKVYFIKENEEGTYTISFGSNNLGKPIVPGNVITVVGMDTNREKANGARFFTYSGTDLGAMPTISTLQAAYAGRDKETLDEIKDNTTNHFFDQDRAIAPIDYVSIVKRYFGSVGSMSAWGGENNIPPVYGKVFLSIKPIEKDQLSLTEETYIRSILTSRNATSIGIEFVQPSYIDIGLDITVYYDKTITQMTANSLYELVLDEATRYNTANLNRHDGIFRLSKFSSLIDNIDRSIQSNITKAKTYVDVVPEYRTPKNYTIRLVNKIYQSGMPDESFKSTRFYLDTQKTKLYYLDDDGIGNIRLMSTNASASAIVDTATFGTIDYETGTIVIPSLSIYELYDTKFVFMIKTESYDVVSMRNQIVRLDMNRFTINIIDRPYSSTTYADSTSYVFTSSRD